MSTRGRLAEQVRGRIAELAPEPAERCGTPLPKGVARIIAATARELRPRARTAWVTLDGGGDVAVDLRTPHGRRIFAYGFCEPASCAMRALLRPGQVVIDAGANIGLFTILAAARVGPEGRVIACEPSPTTMHLLRANVERNAYGWVELREVAVAEQPGRLEMHVFDAGSGFSSFAPATTNAGRRIEVPVETLDEIAGDLLERTGLVKIDVEGAELRALRGASALLERARPDFIVELEAEHLARQGANVREVEALFRDAGYVGYAIRDGRLEELASGWRRPTVDPNIVVRPRERGRRLTCGS